MSAPKTISGSAITSEVVDVTPAIAERWLKKNAEDNRPISWPRVEMFATDMREGNWVLTHQGICFNAEGFLVDGQHRLQAVLSSQATVKMLVFKNPAGKYSDPLDRGKPRSIATILHMRTATTAAINVLKMLENGVVAVKKGSIATLAETSVIYEHHKVWFENLESLSKGASSLPGGVRAALVWAMPVNPAKVREFAEQVLTGEMLKAGDPAYSLRKWRDQNKRSFPIEMALSTLNAVRYAIVGQPLASIFGGESGYRAITTSRRVRKIPHTPPKDLVPTVALKPTSASGGGKSAEARAEEEEESWDPTKPNS